MSTAPPGHPPTPRTAPTPPRGEDPAFAEACARRDYVQLQRAVEGMTARDAKAHLCNLFPHRSTDWMRRNFTRLMALDPDHFWRALHADPTGDTAARRADAARPPTAI